MIRKIKYHYQGKFDPKKLALDNIDRLSTSMVPRNSKILELGCATGFMSQYFKHHKKSKVYGVDLDQNALKLATPHCQQVFKLDLDSSRSWSTLRHHAPFDVVFASAVIEHLKDPWFSLKQIHSFLKPAGYVIITVPNVAHWRNRLDVLLGNWQYQQYGLLDNTHLRFFTYFTIQSTISESGFKITKIAIDPAGGIKYFNSIAKHFPNFYAHQVAIKAQKI